MTLSLGFSPCPNDCFMFDAIVNHRIDLEGLEFSVRMADVEALNQAAFAGEAAVTKLSYHAYALLHRRLRAARRRQRARAGTADRCSFPSAPISKEEVAAGDAHDRHSRASTRPPTSCSAWRFPEARNKTALLFSGDRTRRCWTANTTPG